MSWEWSHTQEAYENAEMNLGDLSVETLIEIAAEWKANGIGGFDEKTYEAERHELMERFTSGKTPETFAETLAEFVWTKAKEQRTCDNGGFHAHLCPFGCEPHMVNFDRKE